MRKQTIALVWLLVAITGVGAFKGLEYSRKTASNAPVEEYETLWKAALNDVLQETPPDLEAELAKAPPWRRALLRKDFRNIDGKYRRVYDDLLVKKLDALASDFRGAWEDAVRNFSDEPSIDKAVAKVQESHKEKLRERLVRLDKAMRRRHPRTKLALDSFLGYCIFRSPRFRERLIAQGIKLHLVDDGADYKKRIATLEKGETPLALFTIDALITNSAALSGPPPAAIVMFVDESHGADAIVGLKKTLPTLGALNHKDAKIVLTADSPSETLERVVRSQFLPRLPSSGIVAIEDDPPEKKDGQSAPEKILARFKSGEDSPRTAWVLWEPYVSMALQANPDAHVLVDSSYCPGFIVDVLVVQKAYLQRPENREQVRKIVRAYLETAHDHRDNMAKLVSEDWQQMVDDNKFPKPLDDNQAQRVARGIHWKNAVENFGHFGVGPASGAAPVKDMIGRITDFLAKADALSRKPDPAALFDASITEKLHAEWKPPVVSPVPPIPPVKKPIHREDLEAVAGMALGDISFAKGSVRINLDLAEVVLRDLKDRLTNWPRYYLEISGHALGDTPEDRELANKRAKAVSDWLQKEGGIPAERLFTAVGAEAGGGKSAVSFLMLKEKEGKEAR